MRQLRMLLPMAALAVLPACAERLGPVDATAPTVTYAYGSDDEYVAAEDKAEGYCDDEYDKEAVLVDQSEGVGGAEVTFACE